MPETNDELLEKIERLRAILVTRATVGHAEDAEYKALRQDLLANSRLKSKLPDFLKSCRDLSDFWDLIKRHGATWADRRSFLRQEFNPVLTLLEHSSVMPSDDLVSAALSTVDSEHIREAWEKALERRNTDPTGAITAARTLIETVCKYILDESAVAYDDKDDLPKLYNKAAAELNLAPSQHTEQAFRQILGGCNTVVNELAGLRNRLSDAHGKGKVASKPAPRHAELAVNLAGTMATFLVATWEARKE